MAEDTDQKDKPAIGGHRQPQQQPAAEAEQPGQQAWTPAKPTQQGQGAEPQQPAAAWTSAKPSQMAAGAAGAPAKAAGVAADLAGAAAGAIPGSTSTVTHTDTVTEKGKKELTAKEKLEAGVQGIISGAGGSEQGKMIGEAVGAGIKNLFGQGDKGAGGPKQTSSSTQVGPGRLGPNADGVLPKADGPVMGGHRQQGQSGAKQEGPEGAGGLDVGGSIGKKVGGMIGSAIGGEKGQTVGQALGKAVGGVAGQAANMAIDHARGIGGSIGGAVGGLVGGEKGASMGKDIGKGVGSAVSSVRDALAGQGVSLGPKQAPGKQGHGVK